jgi:hypothetical protein
LTASLRVGASSAVYLSLAPTSAKPGPRAPARDTTKKADSTKKDAKPPARKPEGKPAPDSTPVDLTIEVVDAAGHTARLPITKYGVPRRPLEIHILRRGDEERQRFPTQFELVLQTYVMPLSDFVRASPQFDAAHLRSIRLVFDRLVAGTVVIDDVGLSNGAGRFVDEKSP